MAITSIGYGGSVDELGWANLTAQFGAEYSVVGNDDFRVQGAATPVRSVVVNPGAAYGNGVYDVSDSAEVLTAAPLGSGTRWDTVVLRRDWQGPGGQSSLVLLPGGTGRSISNQRQVNPGVTCDQPLALVQFSSGSSVPQAIVDLRVWSGDGGLVGRAPEVRQYLTRPGTSVNINGTNWVREFNSSGGLVWTEMGRDYLTETWGQVPVLSANSDLWSRNLVWGKQGRVVHIRARPRRTGGQLNNSDSTIYRLPTELRPTVQHVTTGIRTLTNGRVMFYPIFLDTDGRVRIRAAASAEGGEAIGSGAVIYFGASYRQ